MQRHAHSISPPGGAFDVRVWSTPETRHEPDSLLLDTPIGGAQVRLSQVAEFRTAPTPNTIRREDGARRIDVGANVSGRDLGAWSGTSNANSSS